MNRFISEQGQMLDFLSGSISAYSKKLDSFYSEQFQKSGEFIKKVSDQITDSLKDTTEKATGHMHAMLDSVHQKSQGIADSLAGHATSSVKKMGDESEHAHKKSGAAAGEHKSKLQELKEEFIGNLSASNLLSESVSVLSKNFELISWGLIVNEMRQMSIEISGLFRSMGGNQQELSNFIDQIAGVGLATHLSSNQVIELAEAFHGEALSLNQLTTGDLKDFMTIAGQGMQLFGVSAESAAHFSVEMREVGASANDVHDSFDQMYKTIQINNLAITDIGTSMTEASALMENFGGIAGKSIGKMTNDLLESKAVLKSFGVDVKYAAKDMAEVLGDVNLRTQRASNIAAILGKNSDDVFNAQGTATGTFDSEQAALSVVNRSLGANAYKDQSTLTGAEQHQVTSQIGFASQLAGQQTGLSQAEIQPVLEKYLAKSRSSGHAVDMKEFLDELRKEHQSQNAPGSFNDGLQKYNQSFGRLAANMQGTLDRVLIILGGPLMEILNPMVSVLNSVLDVFVAIVNAPIVKPLIDLGIVVASLMTGFHALVGTLGFLGLGATGFATSLTAVGSACTAIVGGVTAAFAGLEGISLGMAGVLALAAAPLAAAVAGVVALGAALYFGAPMITKAFKDVSNWIGGFFHHDEKATSGPTQTMFQFKPLVDYFFEKTMSFVERLISGVKDWIGQVFHFGSDIASSVGSHAQTLAHAAGSAARNALPTLSAGAHAVAGSLDALTKGEPAAAATLSPAAAAYTASVGSTIAPGLGKSFGWLSSAHEASSPGVVSDYMFKNRRNIAFGNFQQDAGMGTPQQFTNWLSKSKDVNRQHMGDSLKPLTGTIMQGKHSDFAKQWQAIAKQDSSGFLEAQREFAKMKYLDPMKKQFGHALDSPVMQEIAFSTAVHSGTGGAASIFKHAGVTPDSKMSPELIRKLYATRDADTHHNFSPRFEKERDEALLAAMQENNQHLAAIHGAQNKGMQQADIHQKQAQRQAMLGNGSTVEAARMMNSAKNGLL